MIAAWCAALCPPPAGAQIRSDEEVIFFPTAASLSDDGRHWSVPVHCWVFEPERNSIARRALLQELIGELDLDPHTPEQQTFQERARWLLVDNERGKQVEIAIGEERFTLPRTAEDGHCEDVLTVPVEVVEPLAVDGRLTVRAVLADRDRRSITGTVTLVRPRGLTIISDLDDTVKVSEVRDRRRLLRNTFVEPFQAVHGMAARYADWSRQGAVLHFVSSSPWQLYPPLHAFLQEEGFPEAIWHLKRIRLKDPSIRRLFADPYDSKLAVLVPILQEFPERRFLLIGDSGEKDPEVYGEVARRFPGQILRIAIRDVTDEAAGSTRYRDAFRDVPPDRWQIFERASEIELPADHHSHAAD